MDGGTNLADHRRAVGRRIRQSRAERSLSQAELARRAGIAQASLSNYETGRRDLPLSIFLRVAQVLSIDINELLADRDAAASDGRERDDVASTRGEPSRAPASSSSEQHRTRVA